jgi:hypothetical protein
LHHERHGLVEKTRLVAATRISTTSLLAAQRRTSKRCASSQHATQREADYYDAIGDDNAERLQISVAAV